MIDAELVQLGDGLPGHWLLFHVRLPFDQLLLPLSHSFLWSASPVYSIHKRDQKGVFYHDDQIRTAHPPAAGGGPRPGLYRARLCGACGGGRLSRHRWGDRLHQSGGQPRHLQKRHERGHTRLQPGGAEIRRRPGRLHGQSGKGAPALGRYHRRGGAKGHCPGGGPPRHRDDRPQRNPALCPGGDHHHRRHRHQRDSGDPLQHHPHYAQQRGSGAKGVRRGLRRRASRKAGGHDGGGDQGPGGPVLGGRAGFHGTTCSAGPWCGWQAAPRAA